MMAYTCKKCALEVKSSHNGVACELCGKWHHAKCVGITTETYKFLKACCAEASSDSSPTSNGGVMWFCQDCMGPATQMIKNISAIQKRQEDIEEELKQATRRMNSMELEIKDNKKDTDSKINDNQKEIKDLEKEMSDMNVKLQMVQEDVSMNHENVKWSDIVNQAVDSKLETVSAGINMMEKSIEETRIKTQEIRDKEDRRNNIILYNVPESQPGSYEEVMKHDNEYFLQMCEEVFGLDVAKEDVKKLYRIGRRGTVARPLFIQLSSGMLKNNIMETTFKLRKVEKFKHIIVAHDMTKMEREECKRLVGEAKEREAQETTGEYIYRVRGPPGGMKIVKLKKRTYM